MHLKALLFLQQMRAFPLFGPFLGAPKRSSIFVLPNTVGEASLPHTVGEMLTPQQVLGSCPRVLLEPALEVLWVLSLLWVLGSCPWVLLEPALEVLVSSPFSRFFSRSWVLSRGYSDSLPCRL